MVHQQHHSSRILTAATACFLLALYQLPTAAEARTNRATIACSMYVSPCHCGLCPRIVDCAKTPTAECFCGTKSPGIYPHPTDRSKFWMCSYDTQSHIPYGVEVPCPSRLVFDPLVKVCTVPAAVSPSPTPPAPTTTTTSTPPSPSKPKTSTPGTNNQATGSSDASSNTSLKDDNNSSSSSSSKASSNDSSKAVAAKGQAVVGVISEGRAATYRMPAKYSSSSSTSMSASSNGKP